MNPLLAAMMLVAAMGDAATDGQPEPARVGEIVPDFDFRPLHGHDGRRRLEQLRGHPVLVVGYFRHLVTGLHAAKVGDELMNRYGKDGLIVILRERNVWKENLHTGSQGWSFWLRFFESRCWISNGSDKVPDLPIVRKDSKNDDRSLVLIGVDGRLLMEVSAPDYTKKRAKNDVRVQLARRVADEMQRRAKGWGEDKAAVKARALLHGKGDLSGALKLVDRADGDVPELDQVRTEIAHTLHSRAERARGLLDLGRIAEARDAWKKLPTNAAAFGSPDAETQQEVLSSFFSSAEAKRELSLDKKLTRLLQPVSKGDFGKVDFQLIHQLRDMAEKHSTTRVGQRARRIDPVVKSIVSATKHIGWMKMEDAIERAR